MSEKKTKSSKRFELAVQGTRNKTENQAELTHQLDSSFINNRGFYPQGNMFHHKTALHDVLTNQTYSIQPSTLDAIYIRSSRAICSNMPKLQHMHPSNPQGWGRFHHNPVGRKSTDRRREVASSEADETQWTGKHWLSKM